MGTTVCVTSGQLVDNPWFSTDPKTTTMQDVLVAQIPCDVIRQSPHRFAAHHPQSTGLITVINDVYKHAQITMEQR
jgi:hypothetical protein